MEKRLKELTFNNTNYESKYFMYCRIKEDLSKQLAMVLASFPHFSMHDSSHSENILTYIRQLLGDEIEKISASDLLILCLAAYAHDISMAVSYNMIYKLKTSKEWNNILKKYTKSQQEDFARVAERLLLFPNSYDKKSPIDIYEDVTYIIEENFRAGHAERSSVEILNNENIGKLLGIRIRKILSEVCRLHGCDISEIMKLPYEENGLFDDYIHPRFVAAFLSLGDLLDMDTERFDKEFLKTASPMLTLSKIHKKKHESLIHYLVKDGNIEIKSDCDSMEVYRAMREWVEWIKQTTEYISIHWRKIAPANIGVMPYLNECIILLNGDTKWLDFANTKFEISTKHALDLLGGTSLYSDKFYFIRELIQNAVDATIKRIYMVYLDTEGNIENKNYKDFLNWLLKNHESLEKYKVEANITIENGKVKFVIKDKGVGISRNEILRMARVEGKTEEEKDFIQSMPDFYRPSGAFGIGIHSVFSVADSFEVVTRTESEETKRILFHDAKNGNGYITVSDCSRRPEVGTTLTVYLDENRFTQDELDANDYIYAVGKKEYLIYSKLLQKIRYNQNKNFSSKKSNNKQIIEYVPIVITNDANEFQDRFDKTILKYENMFSNDVFSENIINYTEESIEISFYDGAKGCIFKGRITSKNSDKNIVSSKDDFMTYGNYANSVYYKNKLVLSENRIVKFSNKANRNYCFIDYSINILSGSADEILTLDRNRIRDSAKSRITKLIKNEIDYGYKIIIDDILENNINLSQSFMVILYQAAKQLNYRNKEIVNKFSDFFEKIQIGGYKRFNMDSSDENDNNDYCFTLKDLIKEKLLFVKKCSRIDCEKINANTCEFVDEKNNDDILQKVLLDYEFSNNNSHILNHKLEEKFLYKYQNNFYEILVVKPFEVQNNIPYEMDDYHKVEQFLYVIFGNLRCIKVWPSYKDIITNFSSGLGILGGDEKRLEVGLDKEIKKHIADILQEKGYIEDSKQIYNKIIYSKTYKDNLNYIKNNCELPEQDIETLYKQYWEEQLLLFENKKYCEFIIYKSKEINQSVHYNYSEDDLSGYIINN